MITVITGLPGNGKTLFALWFIKKYADSENRPVYYSGISDLLLPWTLIEPEKWLDLPPGAIMVIDEAQFVFPKKPNGASLPEFYSKLAIHRHKGIDIFLITQHPGMIDAFVRKLVGRHFHAVRKFGMQRSTIYEWGAINDAPTSLASQKAAIPLRWSFPSEVYGWYKSAEAHTVKRSIPAKLILAVLFVVAVVCFGFYMLKMYQRRAGIGVEPSVADASVSASSTAGSRSAGGAYVDPMADARAFVHMNTPRIKGIAHTAPKYDELTKPKRVPVPAMCVSSAKHCKCFTQQATPIDVDPGACRDFARDGFFQEFDPDGESESSRDRRTGDSAQHASSVRPSASEVPSSDPVASFSHDPAWYKAGSSGGGGTQGRAAGKGAMN